MQGHSFFLHMPFSTNNSEEGQQDMAPLIGEVVLSSRLVKKMLQHL